MSMCAKDYPEHLNPFDENYNGVVNEEPCNSKQKYNTWSASRPHQLSSAVVKPKPAFLEKPWAALNISPKGKIVRRLSILKTAVEKIASKKKRLTHSNSYTECSQSPRSHSVHDDFSFRIISPKLKEKIRQQAFSAAVKKQEPVETDSAETPSSPQLNGRLSQPLNTENAESLQTEDSSSTSPEKKEISTLGARSKTRKKRPPPPPPTETPKPAVLELSNGQARSEDSQSANSSITHDLEKDASSGEENSLNELEHSQNKCEKDLTDQ